MRLPAALAALVLAAVALAPVARAQGGGARDESPPGSGDSVQVEQLPEALLKVAPECPREIRGIEGTVIVHALVGRNGLVADTRVRSSVPRLDTVALEAVRRWVFAPAVSYGKPVSVWVAVPVKFAWTAEGTLVPPWPAPTADESRRALVQEITALRMSGPRVPSAADSALRGRIIQDALALDPRPLVPPEARAYLERGRRARDRCACRESTQVAVREFARALHEAPWWGPPCLQLGEALLRLDRKAEALVCLELYLSTGPEARERERVEKRIAGLTRRPWIPPPPPAPGPPRHPPG